MKNDYDIGTDISVSETDDEMKQYAELSKAARKRRETPQPDVAEEWARFVSAHSDRMAKRRNRAINWRTVRDMFIGAAAMFALMLAYNHYSVKDQSGGAESEITAKHLDKLRHTAASRHDDGKQSHKGRGSMPFMVTRDTASAAHSALSAITEKAQARHVGMQKLSTPRGMDFKVLLPDGSEVWLNAESTIEFPVSFTGSNRIVTLKGEAYFKVARNEQQPFIVNTERMAVRVLGTEFNLKSYKEETPHVSLVKGKVEVLQGNDDSNAAQLKPGQDAWVDKHGSMHVREIDTYAVTQWIRGYFYFDDAPLVDILRDLSRWYNCGVVFNNRAAMDWHLHFSASREGSLDQAVEDINRLCKAKITIEDNDLVVN